MGRLSSRDRKLAHVAGQNVNTVEHRNFAPLSASASQLVLQSPCPITPTTGILLASEVAYWVYLGYTQKTLVVDTVEGVQTVAAVGASNVAELALATTPTAPAGTGLTMTVTHVAANDEIEDLTTPVSGYPEVKGTINPLGWTVSPCTHLWAGIRAEMATNPTMLGLGLDLGVGNLQATALVINPLVVGQSYVGVDVFTSVDATAVSPLLRCIVRG